MSDLPPPLPTPSTDDASSITSAPVQPTLPGQTIWGMTIDVSGLQNRIFQLERELQFEKREKESMRAKYVLDLEEREKKHRKKIKEMEGEVEMLKKQLADSNRAISELRSEMHKEIAINKRQRARLLCGSVAYVYIESAVEFVFRNRSRPQIRRLKRELSTIEDIQEELKEDVETAQWTEFATKFYADDYDNVLQKLAKDRVNIAHPTTEDDDSDGVPPERMQEIIHEVYNQKANRSLRVTAVRLVDSLDSLRRALGKSDLLG
ncbi:uncharacterized protein ACA1_275040 [Acanthamoeba castellanii str. Neff]|uniref:Uncharacterized protein n=1 Tax=Acanthamoeba castellanii (strain ATCC 30010 / Neff) TaxID=1257118 RepID=L8GFQ1_ACACF|nr:uncharacterized protein ACA1_275040 [Acanthamoeba castellanii str. Neff]ELR11915.1 hypothetical protein ACA1_275040 [Acanthamoeba castellanii str. Neff]